MQLCYVVQQLGKITNINFDIICKKTGCLGKMAITFAYDLGSKSFLYEKASTRKVTSEFNGLWPFAIFLESSNSKGKIEFSAILDFGAKKNSKKNSSNSNCFPIFKFFCCFFYFSIILNFLYYFGFFIFFCFLRIFEFF